MLMIRLQRVGRKNDPSYRLVVTEKTNAAKKSGRFLRVLGNYDPRRDHSQVDAEAVKGWMAKGAKLSPTVHNLLVNLKIIDGKKINVLPKKTVEKKEEVKAEEAAPVTEAPVETPAEEPKEEVVEEVKEEVAEEKTEEALPA